MDKNSQKTRSNIVFVHAMLFLAFLAVASQFPGTVATVALMLAVGALVSGVVTFRVMGGE